jgi:4-amino-4-deoxy-L-arabinose transferase-like glycosyltransferase
MTVDDSAAAPPPGPDDAAGPSSSAPPTTTAAPRRRWYASSAVAVIAATVAFAAVCLGFLINTPTLLGPDEVYHFDRVVAAEHGQIVLKPGAINVSRGARGIEHTYVKSYMHRYNTPSWAQFKPIPRVQRPSLDALGGNARSPKRDVANYETQHPPLYYGLMGGLVRLWPGADAMAGDKFVLLVRTFNVLLMLTLPVLFWLSAKWLLGDNPAARAAAFLPLLVPGLARCAATVNNDNLAIPVGSLAVALCIRVLRGDRSLRTALLIAVTCLAGTLTKSTVVFVLWLVPVAYILQWVRDRAWPSRPVAITLGTGAVASAAWWVHNYIAYGAVQPNAWGSQFARAQGRPRGSIPIDYGHFFNTLYLAVASRFWGALGLLEPPKLPHDMLVLLTVAIVVLPFVTAAALRGRRTVFLLILAVPVTEQLMVILQAFLHYRHYLAIPGIQGRYVYPGVFGALLPFAVGAVLLLRRHSAWAPLLIMATGFVVSGWALYTSAEFTWLHRGVRLVPSNWHRAFTTLAGFYPLGHKTLLALMSLAVLMVAASVAACAVGCWTRRGERYGWAELRGSVPDRETPEAVLVPAS